MLNYYLFRIVKDILVEWQSPIGKFRGCCIVAYGQWPNSRSTSVCQLEPLKQQSKCLIIGDDELGPREGDVSGSFQEMGSKLSHHFHKGEWGTHPFANNYFILHPRIIKSLNHCARQHPQMPVTIPLTTHQMLQSIQPPLPLCCSFLLSFKNKNLMVMVPESRMLQSGECVCVGMRDGVKTQGWPSQSRNESILNC